MRAVFLALLIALLPLRGWVGDVMAMERVAPAAPAAHHMHHDGASDCEHTPTDMGHAMADAHADEPQTAAQDCSGCTACQICHSAALAPVLLHVPVPRLALLAPQARLPQDMSAERAPGFKPPIL